MNCLKCQLIIKNHNDTHYGLHKACFEEWFNAPSSAEFVALQRKISASSSESISLSPENSSFFHGKFKKYSAELNGESYILKMRQKEAQELPEVEYLCNQIAYLLEIPVAKFYYIDFQGDKIFVTKNFISSDVPHDLQHIYHFRNNEQHDCKNLIDVVTTQTKRPEDVRIFIQTLLFDALIGNHDRHGRNLAFIITGRGAVLSPIYDNVSFLSLESGNMLKADFNPTGKISTSKTSEPNMCDYLKELTILGYQHDVELFYQKLYFFQSSLFQLIEKSFCSDLMKKAIEKLVQKRFKELKDALPS